MNPTQQLFDLSGKTAIVTGASSGLGVTFAETLSQAGANVVLAARRADKLQTLAKQIADQGGNPFVVRCDVDDAAQVEQLVSEAAERFGRIDVLVNNAGVVAEAGMMPEKVLLSVRRAKILDRLPIG